MSAFGFASTNRVAGSSHLTFETHFLPTLAPPSFSRAQREETKDPSRSAIRDSIGSGQRGHSDHGWLCLVPRGATTGSESGDGAKKEGTKAVVSFSVLPQDASTSPPPAGGSLCSFYCTLRSQPHLPSLLNAGPERTPPPGLREPGHDSGLAPSTFALRFYRGLGPTRRLS